MNYVGGLVGSGDELQVWVRSKSNELREHGVVPIDPTRGRFLELIARIKSPRRILEIGSGAGYSALWFMKGMGRGESWKLSRSTASRQRIARGHQKAGLQRRIKIHHGEPGNTSKTKRAVRHSLHRRGQGRISAVLATCDEADFDLAVLS